jgi:hypothetical protein
MNKIIINGILGALLILAGGPVQAFDKNQAHGMRGMVDDATVKAVQEARVKFKADTLDLRRQMRLKRAELQVLLLGLQPAPEELLAKNREVQTLANQMSDKRLLQRVELGRKYPELKNFQGRKRAKSGSKGQARRGRGKSSGMAQGKGQRKPQVSPEIQTARQEFHQATTGLRSDIQLKKAQLRVLVLTPATAPEALLAKNRELHALTNQLGEKRLLHRFEMAKKHPELALWQGRSGRQGRRF